MRRVITGLNEFGKSVVLYDGPYQSIHHLTNANVGSLQIENVAAIPDHVLPEEVYAGDIWETAGAPLPGDPDPVPFPQQFSLEPDGTGFRARLHVFGADLDSSAMHVTNTLDINVVISGQLTLLLEEGQSVTLAQGDAVVLRGNAHGWKAGPSGAVVLNIMQRMANIQN
jgi:quercetin dioxygenase-like cupin family protein